MNPIIQAFWMTRYPTSDLVPWNDPWEPSDTYGCFVRVPANGYHREVEIACQINNIWKYAIEIYGPCNIDEATMLRMINLKAFL